MPSDALVSAASSAAIAAVRESEASAPIAIPELVAVDGACAIIGGRDTPIHKSTLWRGIRAGRFPRPIKLSSQCSRWRVDELVAALERAAAERAA